MAVTRVQLIPGRTFKLTDKPVTDADLEYRVTCDAVADGPDVAAAALPYTVGSPYSATSPGLTCRSVEAKESGERPAAGVIYDVSLSFSTEDEDRDRDPDNPETAADPTERGAVVRLSFDSYEETVFRHKDAVPLAEYADGAELDVSGASSYGASGSRRKYVICFSNGNPLPDGLRETFRDPVLTYTKNVETSDFAALYATLIEFMDGVNSVPFAITYRGSRFPVGDGQGWLSDISSEPGYENGVAYEAVTLSIKLRKDGWRRRVVDRDYDGYPTADFDVSKPAPQILDAQGEPVTRPVYLDGKGQASTSGKPVILKFRTKNLKNFRTLPFPEFGA
jgi:hypothetical protein